MNFYNKYVRLCKQKEIATSKAGEEIGVSRSAVSRWAQGTKPTPATMVKISDYFGVPVSYFDDDKLEVPEFNLQLFAEGLSSQEKALLAAFRPLDEVNRAKALVYITGLATKG